MVLSQINKSIEYPPAKFVDPEDLDYDAQLYQIELFPELEIIIALGKVKYTFIECEPKPSSPILRQHR